MTFRSIIVQIILVCSVFSINSFSQTVNPKEDEADTNDLGILPESFDMALDSLLSAKYKQYYSLSKNNRVSLSEEERTRDELYRKRVEKMESAIPLPYNSVVREAIDMYVNKRSTLISSMLAKSTYYFPMIEQELDKYGLPLELKYLSIVESALEPTAVSRSGATGLWQFMFRTGKIYGLKIDSLIDERRDPVKSTTAMCHYFKDMYEMYGDWLIAIAAYNCGPGNMNKAIRQAGGAKDFWKVYPYLPRQTKSYVPFFIAAYYSMEHYKEHDIRPSAVTLPLATDTVHINEKISFSEISRVSNVSTDVLKRLNPQYHKEIVPGNQGTQILVMPTQEAITFATKGKEELRSTRKNVKVAKTEEAVDDGEQSDEVAEEAKAKKATSKNKTKSTQGKYKTHKVSRGESLFSIAKKYKGVTVDEIKKANGLKSSKLDVGQKLKIPR